MDEKILKSLKQLFVSIIVIVICTIFAVMALGITWITVCGLVKLATWAFRIDFNWCVATVVWMFLMVLAVLASK